MAIFKFKTNFFGDELHCEAFYDLEKHIASGRLGDPEFKGVTFIYKHNHDWIDREFILM
jgi:hypothetical protein